MASTDKIGVSSCTVSNEKQIPPVHQAYLIPATPLKRTCFCAMDCEHVVEKFTLDGRYAMIRHRNPHTNLESIVDEFSQRTTEHMRSKQVFVEGNILFKENAPGIQDAIDLMVKATGLKELPSSLDTSVYARKSMASGTICPTIDTIFRYNGNLFIVYGRYIYGYSTPYVRFVNEIKSKDPYKYTPDHYEECAENNEVGEIFVWGLRRKPVISGDEIVLPTISYTDNPHYAGEYNYCFCILEEATNTLLAFAVYC